MPITLGCPTCAKRFRARDESAGKKVKCPYCQAAVPVPTPEESAAAGAPTATLPPPAPAAAVVASPDEWGALPTGPAPAASPAPPPVPPPESEPPPVFVPAPVPARAAEKDRDRPAPKRDRDRPKGEETPEEVLARRWNKVRRGLFWVQFALCWLMLLGFVELGKTLYERQVGPLPRGDGAEWVTIEGYVNTPGPNAITLRKEQLLNLAAYGVPAALAALLLAFGRLRASGGPHISGSRGLYLLSSLCTLLAFAALVAPLPLAVLHPKEARYAEEAFVILLPLAELWFLVALTASGLALKKPGTARRVGVFVYLLAVMLYGVFFGWAHLLREFRPFPAADERLCTQAAFAGGWFLLVAAYWFAIRSVRAGAREYVDAVAAGE